MIVVYCVAYKQEIYTMQHSYDEHTRYLVNDPDYEDDLFNARHSDQVARATNSVFNEMCYELDVKEYRDLVLKNLNKRSVFF